MSDDKANRIIKRFRIILDTEYGKSLGGQSITVARAVEVLSRALKEEEISMSDDTSQTSNGNAVDENTSDGYHTFKELYLYRMLYNAALFNEWSKQRKYQVHKSWRHSDGTPCFGGGWFIVMAELPTGQISNHYEEKYWSLFSIPEESKAAEYDGHSPNDVAERLAGFLAMTRTGDSQ